MRDWTMAERDLERIRRAQAKVESRVDSLQTAREERQQAIKKALDSGRRWRRSAASSGSAGSG